MAKEVWSMSISTRKKRLRGNTLFLKESDVWSREGHHARRFFMVQLTSSPLWTNARLAEVKIWAVSKQIRDQIPDGQMISDQTCLTCRVPPNALLTTPHQHI